MRAAVFKGAREGFVIEDRPVPEPGPGELVIKVARCGICGTDLTCTSGGDFDFPINSVTGHEYCGEVVQIGLGVEGFRQGDIVSGMPGNGCGQCEYCKSGRSMLCTSMTVYASGFAEYALTGARGAVLLPRSLTLADGALVEPLAVGLHGATLAAFRPGTRVLVLGAGSVGLSTIFWARQLGAGRIIAASRSMRRAELAQALGADAFVPLGQDERAQIVDRLGGSPDVVFECVGKVGMISKSIALARPGGTVVSMGFCVTPDEVVPALAALKQLRLVFSIVYTLAEFEQVARTLDRGLVLPRLMVSDTIPLEQFPGMIAALRADNAYTKVHVDPWAFQRQFSSALKRSPPPK